MGALLVVFCVPLVTVGGDLSADAEGDLFNLTFNLFGAFWLLGWSMGVAIVGLVFFALVLGNVVANYLDVIRTRYRDLRKRLEVGLRAVQLDP